MKMGKKTGEAKAKSLEEKAADAILSKGTKFTIRGLGRFTMNPLYLGTLVSISKEALKIEIEARKGITMLNIIASTKKNALPAARIIAKAILNSKIKIALFSSVFARMLYWKLTPSELDNLVTLVIKNSEADFFFNSTILLSGMRVMAPTKETTASGEQLPD